MSNTYKVTHIHTICCGCAYVYVFSMLQFLSSAKLLEVALDTLYLPRGKPEYSVVVEAVDPFKWASTSISNTYWVFHHLHILWVCIMCICPYHVTATLVNRLLEVASNSPYPPRDKLEHSVVVEAMDPFKWAPTSMSNTY